MTPTDTQPKGDKTMPTKIEKLALKRANEIIEAWWYEDTGESQDEYGITDNEMEELLSVPFEIVLIT